MASLVDRGLLCYDEPVSASWPEFARRGKARVTVAEVLRHESGLANPAGHVEPEALLREGIRDNRVGRMLEGEALSFPEGTRREYHPFSRYSYQPQQFWILLRNHGKRQVEGENQQSYYILQGIDLERGVSEERPRREDYRRVASAKGDVLIGIKNMARFSSGEKQRPLFEKPHIAANAGAKRLERRRLRRRRRRGHQEDGEDHGVGHQEDDLAQVHHTCPGQVLMPRSFRYAPFQPAPLVVRRQNGAESEGGDQEGKDGQRHRFQG